MINKKTKDALYAQILIESSDLIMELEKESKSKSSDIKNNNKPNGMKPFKVDSEVHSLNKESLLSLHRIRNNAMIMLLRGGCCFYTNSGNWKDSKDIYLNVNDTIYSFNLQNVKTLLSIDYEKVLNKCYSPEHKNNEIELSKINKFNFDNNRNVGLKESAYDIGKGGMADDNKLAHLDAENIIQHVDETNGISKPKNEKTIKTCTRDKKAVSEVVEEVILDEELDENGMAKGELIKSLKANKTDLKQRNIIARNVKNDINGNSDKTNYPFINNALMSNEQRLEEKIESIESSNNIKEITSLTKKEIAKSEGFTVNDLVLDIYTVLFQEKTNPDNKKSFTIIVAPADINREYYASFAPTFTFAKSGKNVCNCSSPNKSRSSYQIMLDDETFVIRGKWSDSGFLSLVYPLNVNNKEITIQQKHIRPIKNHTLGHVLEVLENGIKVHILPLSSNNTISNYVGILVCLEDSIGDKYLCSCSKDHPNVEITYNMVTYKISATWINKKLIPTIQFA